MTTSCRETHRGAPLLFYTVTMHRYHLLVCGCTCSETRYPAPYASRALVTYSYLYVFYCCWFELSRRDWSVSSSLLGSGVVLSWRRPVSRCRCVLAGAARVVGVALLWRCPVVCCRCALAVAAWVGGALLLRRCLVVCCCCGFSTAACARINAAWICISLRTYRGGAPY